MDQVDQPDLKEQLEKEVVLVHKVHLEFKAPLVLQEKLEQLVISPCAWSY